MWFLLLQKKMGNKYMGLGNRRRDGVNPILTKKDRPEIKFETIPPKNHTIVKTTFSFSS